MSNLDREILELFRQLPPEMRREITDFVREVSEGQQAKTSSDRQ